VDLKPPSSHLPSSSSSVTDGGTDSSSLGIGNNNPSDHQPQGENEVKQERPLSPYTRFVDLKPPSSPSTSLPSSSSSIIDGGTASSLDSNANSIPASNSNPSDQPQGEKEEKQQRPLSSYTSTLTQIWPIKTVTAGRVTGAFLPLKSRMAAGSAHWLHLQRLHNEMSATVGNVHKK